MYTERVCAPTGSPDVLELLEIDRPVAADDEVLVRVRAASVNEKTSVVAQEGNTGGRFVSRKSRRATGRCVFAWSPHVGVGIEKADDARDDLAILSLVSSTVVTTLA